MVYIVTRPWRMQHPKCSILLRFAAKLQKTSEGALLIALFELGPFVVPLLQKLAMFHLMHAPCAAGTTAPADTSGSSSQPANEPPNPPSQSSHPATATATTDAATATGESSSTAGGSQIQQRPYEWLTDSLAGDKVRARGYHSATASQDGSKVYIFGGIAACGSIDSLAGESHVGDQSSKLFMCPVRSIGHSTSSGVA